LRVIRDLLAFQPAGRGTNLAAALAHAARLLRHRAIVVVLSDFRAEGWEVPLRRLTLRHEVVAITVDDPRETDLPDAGWIELEDAETDSRALVDTTDSRSRLQLRIAAEETQLQRARVLQRVGVDHIPLVTNRPYTQALHAAFARRARRLQR
jgi:uncharacterized protein (DUF58 family)